MAGRVFALLISMVFASGAAYATQITTLGPDRYAIVDEGSEEFREIRLLFDNLAEEAKNGDIDGVLSIYSGHLEPYRDAETLRRMWNELASRYSAFEIFYPIYSIEVKGDVARVRCERITTGRPRSEEEEAGDEIIEVRRPLVYNLIRQDGVWKIIGGQYPYPELPPSLLTGKGY